MRPVGLFSRRQDLWAELCVRALAHLLDPQPAPTVARDVAVDQLAPTGRDEMFAVVRVLAVFRRRLIVNRGLRHPCARFAASIHAKKITNNKNPSARIEGSAGDRSTAKASRLVAASPCSRRRLIS